MSKSIVPSSGESFLLHRNVARVITGETATNLAESSLLHHGHPLITHASINKDRGEPSGPNHLPRAPPPLPVNIGIWGIKLLSHEPGDTFKL